MTIVSLTTPAGAPALGAPANVIDTHDPHVAWDVHLALHGISLNISNDQTVVLTGANGSGKSTFLHALLAAAPITQGSVRLSGVDNQDSRVIPWKRISYVPQRINPGSPISTSSLGVVMSGLPGRRKWRNFPTDRGKTMATLKRAGLAR